MLEMLSDMIILVSWDVFRRSREHRDESRITDRDYVVCELAEGRDHGLLTRDIRKLQRSFVDWLVECNPGLFNVHDIRLSLGRMTAPQHGKTRKVPGGEK